MPLTEPASTSAAREIRILFRVINNQPLNTDWMPRLALKSAYYSSCLSAGTAKSEKDFFTIVFSACAIRHTGRASSIALKRNGFEGAHLQVRRIGHVILSSRADFSRRGICFFSSLLNFSQIPE